MMSKQYCKIRILIFILVPLILHGCAAAIVTTGATGAAVAHDRRTTGTFIEDQSIELKAVKAFFNDKEINDNAHINVTSYNLVVLITGEAPTEEIIQKIVNIVQNIPKVSHVYNELSLAAPNERISFNARFGGCSHHISVETGSILAIYAKENGMGMIFQKEKLITETSAIGEKKTQIPDLQIVK